MKLKAHNIISSLIILLTTNGALHAQYPWQHLSSPATKEMKAFFIHPPSYASHSVTWGWNGPMNQKVIATDLDSLHALGFNVVTIEAGYRMPATYLSDDWFALLRTAVEEAKKRDMHIWIIDEAKYPSGFAGGRFSKERPDLRMQALVVYDRINASADQHIERKVGSSVVSAVAINLADSSSQIINIHSGEISWTAPPGKWQVLLVQPQFKTAVTRASNNPTGGKDTTNSLCDYLNPVAVKQFIEYTHEQYKKHIGNEFGKTVLGFRGDEPDYAYIPWTPAMLQEFKKRKGYDVQPYLASLFVRNMSDEQKRIKADYWDVWSDLFGETYFKLQGDWCAQNNLEYMVHLNHDDAMIGLVKSEGDFYKDFRSVQIPGIDVIWHQLWPGLVADFPKFASSAAHLFGRPRVLSECFAAFNPEPNIEQARWILNQQLVRGINLFELMFFMSTSEGKGGAKGYMADKLFPSLMNYANRAGALLAQGIPAAHIAVYFPTTSLWLAHNESEKSTLDIAQALLASQHDFDFIDEYSLTSGTKLSNGHFINKSGQEYNTIIIPSVNTISKTALNRLDEFIKGGGNVIFTGEHPSIIMDKSFLKESSTTNGNLALQKPTSPLSALSSLPSDLELNLPASSLKYLHRRWKDADLYFIFNEGDTSITRSVTVKATGDAQEWNAENATITKIKSTIIKDGLTQFNITLQPFETKFLVIGSL